MRTRDQGPGSPSSFSQLRANETRSVMYDMYPWNRPEDNENEAAQALQTALDRRDNGGVPPHSS
ncbi:hypothetical protein ABZ470_02335 [Streptosporangium sp. NPDC020072]|uniref:hypothetical protein n=1 Tax=Streptosporangium sp. NPDC020072 TaxID=3154788 RepID=UPI003437753D